jgi:hypothetical protein
VIGARGSPQLDPDREWFNPRLVGLAEGMYRRKFGRPAAPVAGEDYPRASGEDAVREGWEKIPWSELTDAERDLFAQSARYMGNRAKRLLLELRESSKVPQRREGDYSGLGQPVSTEIAAP